MKIPVWGNTGNLEILPKHREFLYTQVVNSHILEIKDIATFAAKFSILFLETGFVCHDRFTNQLLSNHLARRKYVVGQGKTQGIFKKNSNGDPTANFWHHYYKINPDGQSVF